MNRVEKTIEIERPIDLVVQRLRAVEEYPAFLSGVAAVERSGARLAFSGEDGERWDAELLPDDTDDATDRAVSWRRADNGERWQVALIALSATRTRADLLVEHQPQGLLARAGDALGSLDRRVETDLANLKQHIEATTPAR